MFEIETKYGAGRETSDVTASCTYGGIRDHRELPEKLGVSRTERL
jgi:hypothetical protein